MNLPIVDFIFREGGEFVTRTSKEIFSGKRVVVFALPGAFTPTCTEQQLPGFEAAYDEIRGLDVDEVYCLSVNDAFVMDAWGKGANAEELLMVSDWDAGFSKALDLTMDASGFGLGVRSQRFALIAEDGVITHLAVEAPGQFEVSKAEAVLEAL